MKWLLVILSLNSGGEGAVSVEGIGPFDTETLCTQAGDPIIAAIWTEFKGRATYKCVLSTSNRPSDQ